MISSAWEQTPLLHSEHQTKSKSSSPERQRSKRRRKPKRPPSILESGIRKLQLPDNPWGVLEMQTSIHFRVMRMYIISMLTLEGLLVQLVWFQSRGCNTHESSASKALTNSWTKRKKCSWFSLQTIPLTTRSKILSLKRIESIMLCKIVASPWKRIVKNWWTSLKKTTWRLKENRKMPNLHLIRERLLRNR